MKTEFLSNEQAVARMCERAAVQGAQQYLAAHNLKADSAALSACIMSWIKAKLPEAVNDAMDAFAIPGMEKIAEATFVATMVKAGIEAAKESGFPK